MNKIIIFQLSIISVLASISTGVSALETMSEDEMGRVSGRDGVTLNLESSTGIQADQIRWVMDEGSTGPSYENAIHLGKAGNLDDSFRLIPIGVDGAATTDLLDISVAIDAFTNSDNRSGLAIDATWDRMRAQFGSLSVSDDTRSFGAAAFDSAGRFAMIGDGGLFNASTNNARLILNVGNVDASDSNPSNWEINDPGLLFYRMGAAGSTEIQLANFGLLFDMHEGTIGIDNDGIFLQSAPASRTDLNLTFDIYANEANTAAGSFQKTSESIPMLFFGWRGGLDDVGLRLRPQGTWIADNSFTGGLTTSLGFDLADDFQFVIGEAKPEVAGDQKQSYLEFTQPVSLPSTLDPGRKDVEFGYITLDAISAGQGVGGICYGGGNTFGITAGSCSSSTGGLLPVQVIDVPASNSGLALIAREWGLHAYSSNVSYRDGAGPAAGLDVNEGWALIYTLGDISSNVYLYPQTGGGITMDVVTAIQTIGGADAKGRPDLSRWENGTHLMIGDTEVTHPTDTDVQGLAIGLVGSDLIFAANDLSVGLSLFNGLSLSSNEVRLQLRGMFAGGDIPYMKYPIYGSYIDMNFEFDEFVFKLLPALSGDYINFGGFLSFANLSGGFSNSTGGGHGHDDGSYISFAEPNFNKLNVDLRLADITGDIEIPGDVVGGGGKIDLLSATAESDDRPKLRIQTNMKIGALATKPGGGAGDALQIGRVEFGGQNLGTIVVPAGQVRAALTLKQQ